MTVSSFYAPVTATGNGTATTFAVGWPFLLATDLVVGVKDTAGIGVLQTLTVTYTVTGGNGLPGAVVFTTPPPAGYSITITRATPQTQDKDLTPYSFNPSTLPHIEQALDKLTLLYQEALARLAVLEGGTGAVVLPDMTPVLFTITSAQSVFTLSGGRTYTPGSGQLAVFVNGNRISLAAGDYAETSSTSFTTASAVLPSGNPLEPAIVEAVILPPMTGGIASASSVSIQLHPTLPVISVLKFAQNQEPTSRDWGVPEDGTPCRVKAQAYLDYCFANKIPPRFTGGRFYFEGGGLVIPAPIWQGFSIRGAGARFTWFLCGTGAPAITDNQGELLYEDIGFDAQSASYSAGNTGLNVLLSKATIRRCHFTTRLDAGVLSNNEGYGSHIDQNHFASRKGISMVHPVDPGLSGGYSHTQRITGNKFESGVIGIQAKSCVNLDIANNTFDKFASGLGTRICVDVENCRNIRVANNYAEDFPSLGAARMRFLKDYDQEPYSSGDARISTGLVSQNYIHPNMQESGYLQPALRGTWSQINQQGLGFAQADTVLTDVRANRFFGGTNKDTELTVP